MAEGACGHGPPFYLLCGVGKLVIVANTLFCVSSVVIHSLQKHPVRDGEEQGEEPHCQAAALHHPWLLTGIHLGGMDDGQVAVQTDAGQQEDPTVEVNLGVRLGQRNELKPLYISVLNIQVLSCNKGSSGASFPSAHLLP